MMRRFALSFFLLVGLLVSAAAGENVMRNGSLELPFMVGTTTMLQHLEDPQIRQSERWQPTGSEGWWIDSGLPDPESAKLIENRKKAHSGKYSLKLTAVDKPVAIVNGLGQILKPGKYTCTAWLKTSSASGFVQFLASNSGEQYMRGFMKATVRSDVPLPADSGWTRVRAALAVPEKKTPQMIVVRVLVNSGTVWVDDVQVELGPEATPFDVRPGEQIRLSPVLGPPLPFFTHGKEKTLRVRLTCDSRRGLSDVLSLSVARCTLEGRRKVWTKKIRNWSHGESFEVDIDLSPLRPDAYLVLASLRSEAGILLDGGEYVDPYARIGDKHSRSMIKAPCALRFAVITATPPDRLFGSGNRMLVPSEGYPLGFRLPDYLHA